MDNSDTAREEEQYRQAERAMLLAEDAAKRIAGIATDLRKDHAPEHLAAALEDAATSIRTAHREMVKATYWTVPD